MFKSVLGFAEVGLDPFVIILGRRELGKMIGEVAATTWLAMESISIALIVTTWDLLTSWKQCLISCST